MFRIDYGHSEAISQYGTDPRTYLTLSKTFLGKEDSVTGVLNTKVEWNRSTSGWKMEGVPNSEKNEADMVLIAMGFLGPEKGLLSLCSQTRQSNVKNFKQLFLPWRDRSQTF